MNTLEELIAGSDPMSKSLMDHEKIQLWKGIKEYLSVKENTSCQVCPKYYAKRYSILVLWCNGMTTLELCWVMTLSHEQIQHLLKDAIASIRIGVELGDLEHLKEFMEVAVR